jgi:RNA polymerase sigma factor (sigma-70 family)
VFDADELDPLHVTHDRDSHGGSLTSRRTGALQQMMDTVAIPPFERFYEEYRDEIYAYLRRLAGRDGADDAFQETFLRALRGYPRLTHGHHLRAWAYTIATRVAIDQRRKRRPSEQLPELPADDSRPAYAELDHLTGDLPATERAAVVLRYGYDLEYADIATALGSTEDAARQAASSGVRRLRRRMT